METFLWKAAAPTNQYILNNNKKKTGKFTVSSAPGSCSWLSYSPVGSWVCLAAKWTENSKMLRIFFFFLRFSDTEQFFGLPCASGLVYHFLPCFNSTRFPWVPPKTCLTPNVLQVGEFGGFVPLKAEIFVACIQTRISMNVPIADYLSEYFFHLFPKSSEDFYFPQRYFWWNSLLTSK